MSINWKPLLDLIHASNSFVLTSHQRPDCDALGSELGLALALEALGKRVRIINADPTPPHIAMIDPKNRIEVLGVSATAADAHASDLHLILDTSAWQQLGPMADVFRTSPAKKAVIDHHLSSDDLAPLMLKETSAEATGRLVLELVEALDIKLTAEIATPLFYAIATDTGWFRFPSVNAGTFAALARLVEAGAKPTEVFSSLYDQNTLARVQLHGRVLEQIELAADGRLAHAAARTVDFEATGAEVSDTEDVVNRLLSISGVEVAVVFVELGPERCKASLRSRQSRDVRRVAEQFGGGGHAQAAGVKFDLPLVEAQSQLLAAVIASLE